MNRDNFRKIGRKLELCNLDILSILRVVYTSHKSLSPTDIARIARGDNPNIKKFSNEYKIIKKLCPSFKGSPETHNIRALRFLKVTLKQNVQKTLSEANNNSKQAEHDLKEATAVYGSCNVILGQKESEIKLIVDRCEHAEKRLSEIKKEIEKRGRKDWRYSPIFTGLLLYLYNEREVVDWGKDSTKWKRRESKKYLRRVISNPLVIEEAPFLHHWEVFEEHGFDVIGLLKQIAAELYNQLHITAENDVYLLRRATERYFVQLENHFYSILDGPVSIFFIRKYGTEKYRGLLKIRNEYRELINSKQRAWIKEQNKILDYYEQECNSLDFKKELHRLMDSNNLVVIDTSQLARKYKIPEWHALNLLVRKIDPDQSNYYEYKNKKYLIANPFLILYSNVHNLKSLLCNNNKTINKYSQASTLLASNGIPRDCHSELIKGLGFYIIPENEKGEYDLTDPIIVQKSVYAFREFFNSLEMSPQSIT